MGSAIKRNCQAGKTGKNYPRISQIQTVTCIGLSETWRKDNGERRLSRLKECASFSDSNFCLNGSKQVNIKLRKNLALTIRSCYYHPG